MTQYIAVSDKQDEVIFSLCTYSLMAMSRNNWLHFDVIMFCDGNGGIVTIFAITNFMLFGIGSPNVLSGCSIPAIPSWLFNIY